MGRRSWAKESWKRLGLFQKQRLDWLERLLTMPRSKEGFHMICLPISFRKEQEWPRLEPPRPRRWILKVAPLIKDATSKAQPYLHCVPVAASTSQGQGRGLWALATCWLLKRWTTETQNQTKPHEFLVDSTRLLLSPLLFFQSIQSLYVF